MPIHLLRSAKGVAAHRPYRWCANKIREPPCIVGATDPVALTYTGGKGEAMPRPYRSNAFRVARLQNPRTAVRCRGKALPCPWDKGRSNAPLLRCYAHSLCRGAASCAHTKSAVWCADVHFSYYGKRGQWTHPPFAHVATMYPQRIAKPAQLYLLLSNVEFNKSTDSAQPVRCLPRYFCIWSKREG